ncbi:MAG: hypothetical protein KC502_09050 [Myxococcales bacterium]|nr:hypothetical protein [Myxococcales bacterium]
MLRIRNAASRLVVLAAVLTALAAGCGEGSTEVKGSTDAGSAGGSEDGVISEDAGLTGDSNGTEDAAVAEDTATAVEDTAVTKDADDNDTGGADAADASAPVGCPGSAGCECSEASDCDQGVCIDTADGKKCAQTCTENCPGGSTCKKLGDGDVIFVCVPNFVSLCSPCETNSDCNAVNSTTLCLDYGKNGKFCGGTCKSNGDCPTNYNCIDAPDNDTGKIFKQCKLAAKVSAGSGSTCSKDSECPADQSCNDGKCAIVTLPMCTCSKWATVFGKSTTCNTTNAFGTCTGKRTCTDKGMSDCSATEAKEETCNGVDDDCDGATDKLPASVTCTVATYLNDGSKSACTKDSDCSAEGEGCDEGQCKTFVGACAGEPKCDAKGGFVCANAKKAVVEACNGLDDDCDTDVDEDFGWAEPGTTKKLPLGAACGQGACAGGKVACVNLIKATCTTADKVSKEKCDDADNDCNGKVDDAACEDGDECTIDACDGKSGTCTNKPGADCDDSNACTTDSCNTASGKCVNKFYAGTCDDGDACTIGDTCKEVDGKGACVPGDKKKQCDDSNPCTDDSCDKDKGCVTLPNAVTQVCYTGADKTEDVGTCKAGIRYCSKGQLGDKCVGEVVPNKTEACDTKDDNCNGSTDEGCSAKGLQAFTSTVSGTMDGGKSGKKLYVHIDGDGPAGKSVGTKNTLWSGFVAWLVGATGS